LVEKDRLWDLLNERLRRLPPHRQRDPRLHAGMRGLYTLLTSIPQVTPPPFAYREATPQETLERMQKTARHALSFREAMAKSKGPSPRRSKPVTVQRRVLVYGPSQTETMSKIGRQNILLACRDLFPLERGLSPTDHLEVVIRRYHAAVLGGRRLCGKCVRVFLKPLATNKSPACPKCYEQSRLAKKSSGQARFTHAARRRACKDCALYSLPSINPSGKPKGRRRPPTVSLDAENAVEPVAPSWDREAGESY